MRRFLSLVLTLSALLSLPALAAEGDAPLPDLSAYPGLEVTWFPGYELVWTDVSSGGMVAAREVKSGRYGILRADGAVVVPCTYERRIFGYDQWSDRAEIDKDMDQPLSFFDAHGRLVETRYSQIGPFHLDRALVVDAETGKCGFIDDQYREVIPCVYDQDNESQGLDLGFLEKNDGYTVIARDGVPGLLDRTGNFSIPAGFDGVLSISAGGTRIVAFRLDQDGNRSPALLDRAGNVLVPAGVYDEIAPFVGGLAAVTVGVPWSFENEGRCGAVGLDGQVVVPVEYAGVDIRLPDPRWSGVQAYVWSGTAWGLYDETGKQLLPCAYNQGPGRVEEAGSWDPPMTKMYRALNPGAPEPEWPPEYEDGLTSFVENDRIGFRDAAGSAVVPAVFDGMCGGFSNGWCALKKDGVWGLVKNPLYRDRVSAWAEDEVAAAKAAGLVTERAGSYLTYNVTRIQFAELAVDLVEKTTGKAVEPAAADRFTDTADVTARKAAAAGIVSGTGDGSTFSPETFITREEIAAMLYRALSTIGTDLPSGGDLAAYPDGAQVSDWAKKAMTALARSGILKGSDDKELAPRDLTTVEQAILLVLRASETKTPPYVEWLDLPAGPEKVQACRVVLDGRDYYLTDQDGKVLVPAGSYDYIGQPMDGLLPVLIRDTTPDIDPYYVIWGVRERWGLIDTFGTEVTPPEYDSMWQIGGPLIPVQKGYGDAYIGFLDRAGREVVPCVFVQAGYMYHGGEYLFTPSPDFMGLFIDRDGNAISVRNSDYGPVRGEHGLWGYADETGTLVTPQEYESVSEVSSEGLALVKKNGTYGLMRLW